MSDTDVLRPEWRAFEQELGFAPKLHGPTYEDMIKQDGENGEALMSKYTFTGPDTTVRHTEHKTVSGIRLKAYTPPTVKYNQPLVYYCHGGGFALGSVDLDDRFVDRHAKDTGYVFVSVEYRLAPAHKYPAALNDCVEGANWCLGNAGSLGARDGKIVIMGKSAGGSLALGVVLKLIDEGKRDHIQGVVPCQPCAAHPDTIPSVFRSKFTAYDENAENTVNTKKGMLAFYEIYGAPYSDPYTYPVLHPKLGDLSKVYMNACGADTLRDDARLVKNILDKNCVLNRYDEYARLPHYFFAFPSSHLDKLRDEYFAKTAEGIEWIVNG